MSLFVLHDIHSEMCHQSHPKHISPAVSLEVFAVFCTRLFRVLQGGSNMTGTDLCVNKPHCAAAVRP